MEQLRKRKRPSYDNDLAFYRPTSKGQPTTAKTDGEIPEVEVGVGVETPTITGLSKVPAIGQWLTSEELAERRGAPPPAPPPGGGAALGASPGPPPPSPPPEAVDHIALVQRDVLDVEPTLKTL